MKTSLMNKFKLVVLGLIMVTGIGVAHATIWTAPTGTPPANNTEFPIHVRGSAQPGGEQVKLGGLSLGTFLALMNAQFDADLYLQGAVHGGSPGDAASTVTFGGTEYDIAGQPHPHNVDLLITGGLEAEHRLHSSTLAHPGDPTLKPVCVQANTGVLILCP